MDTQNIEVEPNPSAAGPKPRAPLRRSTTDRVIGGVSGGIGRRFGVDPVILRVAFVVGILLAGFGPLLYLALWLLLPDDTDRSAEPLTREPVQLVLGLVLAVVALGSAVHWITMLGELTGLIVAGFLVGLGIWLYTRRGYAPAMTAAPEPPPPPVGYAYGGTGATATASDAGVAYGAPTGLADPPPAAPQPPRRPRSYLGLITLCVALLVAGVLGVAQARGWVTLTGVAVMAILLGVLSVGLIVGAFAGRARWLLVPAVLLALVMAVTAQVSSFLPGAFSNGVGERSWAPVAPGASYALGWGQASLDLTQWAGTPGARQPSGTDTVSATLTAGELNVVVPTTWNVVVDARVGAGDIRVDGERVDEAAIDARYRQTIRAQGEATGTIRLVLDAQYGTIRIDSAALGFGPAPTPTESPLPERTAPARDDTTTNPGRAR